MIHQIFTLTRPLFVLDCETTGTDVEEDRIIELGFQMWTNVGLKREWRSRINPSIPIPKASTEIHHITDLDVQDRPGFKQFAPLLADGFKDCDYAGKKVRFDLRMMSAEMIRADVAWNYVGARIIDADRLEQLGEPRSLSDLVKKHLGEDMGDAAHSALDDVQWTTKLIAAQLEKYSLPRDLDALHELQWKGWPEWLTNCGRFKVIDGVPTCCFGKKWNKRAMKDIDVGFYDWILKGDFPADVKRLAGEAKLGKFPEVKK